MQLVQLQQSKKALEKLGYSVAALSYDSPEILQEFAKRRSIDYPMIADPESTWLKSAGLFDQKATGMTAGMALPATLVLDPEGRVRQIYRESAYQDRLTPGTLVGILSGASAPEAIDEAPPEKATVSLSQSDTSVTAGSLFGVQLTVALPPGQHLYAPGSEEGIPMKLEFAPHPFLEVLEVVYPEPKRQTILGAEALLYEGRTTLSVRAKVKSDKELRPRFPELGQTPLKGSLEYQICTDKLCMPPDTTDVEWTLEYLPLDLERSSEELRHQ